LCDSRISFSSLHALVNNRRCKVGRQRGEHRVGMNCYWV
jgi:hypothetical protein